MKKVSAFQCRVTRRGGPESEPRAGIPDFTLCPWSPLTLLPTSSLKGKRFLVDPQHRL